MAWLAAGLACGTLLLIFLGLWFAGWLDEWIYEKPVPTAAVRNDCAFCGRERTPKDDNHAPGCPYWDFFGC